MNKNLKVTFCIPSLGSGGAERVISVLANKFIERGIEVTILLISNLKCQYDIDEKIQLQCLHCDEDNNLPFRKRYFLRLKKIKNAIKKIKPDIVISFMSETNIDVCFALYNINIPIIVSERNDPAIDPSSKIKKILRQIAYFKPKGFVFQTVDAQNYFSLRVKNKAKIILNPLTSQLPNVRKYENTEKKIVAVGRLNKQKNFPMLINSFKKFSKIHPEYILEIYGEGVLKNELMSLILKYGLEDKIFLKGFCKNVHEKISTASMFVMTSNFEGMPNALLEAMAMGLVCISTDCPCGGPRMLIKQKENGILVPIGDEVKLVEAMDFVASNLKEAKKMSNNALEILNVANVEKITDEWIEMIYSCLEE